MIETVKSNYERKAGPLICRVYGPNDLGRLGELVFVQDSSHLGLGAFEELAKRPRPLSRDYVQT